MLRVYVASDCPVSAISRQLIAHVQTCCPEAPVEVVEVDTPHVVVPEHIFATPIYTWNNDIVFLDNPGEMALWACLRRLHACTEYVHSI